MNDRLRRTGGEWIVDALRAEGVRHVFGIPGVHNLAIYDALIRQSEITHVLARHEAGAAFMADGYARASGAPGVVVVTTGPGATNALTPLVESYAGSIPVVVVMSDVACREAKKPHFQVVLAIADKPTPGPTKSAKRG